MKCQTPTDLNEAFYNKHVTFTSIADIAAVSPPLVDLGLSYFTFDRTYKDGSHLRLTNAGKWIEHYYRSGLYKAAIFEQDPRLFCDGFIFWSWLNREPIYSMASEHDIDHGLTIIENHDQYCDFFHFGTGRDNPIPPSQLIEHIGYLHQFISFFRQALHPLIAEADKIELSCRYRAKRSQKHIKTNFESLGSHFDEGQPLNVSRFYFGESSQGGYLTLREMMILKLLKNNKRSSEIAHELTISPRTLETHLNHIKTKLQCRTLFELGYKIGTMKSLGQI